jgi:hypothetical protein
MYYIISPPQRVFDATENKTDKPEISGLSVFFLIFDYLMIGRQAAA